MSHFSLLVLTKKRPDLCDVLEPFNENITLPQYIKYTKEELKAKLRKDLHDYKKGSTYQEWLADKEAYREKHGGNERHIEYLEKTFPQLMKMSNERLYKREIKLYYETEEIDSEGNILSTYNPKSKWDWYVVGGRWEGLLSNKKGEKVNEGYANELDFNSNKIEYENALRFWELWVDKREPKNEDEKELLTNFYYIPEYYVERYVTKENYAKIISCFTTYSVLTPNGNWYEPGEMGWFGCSSADTKDEQDWDNNYYKFIELAKKKNLYLTVVDCHI